MTFESMLNVFCHAVETGDGKALAALFTVDGVYHDGFYGAFRGRDAIAEMLTDRFHGDARDFLWEMNNAVRSGDVGYASYRFSYTSRLAGADGRRVIFEGIGRFRFAGDLIESYDEVFDASIAMVQLDFAGDRIARRATRVATALRSSAGDQHLKGASPAIASSTASATQTSE